ncbi:MAG: hemolysin family protein [Jiangellales bacterium]
MSQTWQNLALVMLLVLLGGLFAAAEIALVSLRESQIKALSARGRRGGRIARLAADPSRFLAAVQIGVTLAGFLSAAFGAATLADDLAPVLQGWGLEPAAAQTTALVLITVIIAYLSLVFGELAPKRLALQRSERVSWALGPPLDVLATLFRPVIWLLSFSSDLVVRLVGGDPSIGRGQITPDELRDMVSGHEELGEEERRIVGDVFDAGDRQIREVMVPRTEVEFLDAHQPVSKAVTEAMAQPHSRYPVTDGSPDDVVGFVHIRDLLDPKMAGRSVRVGALARDVIFLPDTKQLLSALSEMRRAGSHLAIVVDEYGGTDGIVTMEDLVEELIGDIRDEYDAPGADEREPSLGEVDGLLNLDEFAEQTGVTLPDGPYETVAGFVVAQLGRLPAVGESVEAVGHRLEVRSLDGRRIARVHVSALPGASGTP